MGTDKNFSSYYDTVRMPVLQVMPTTAARILDIGGGTGAMAVEVKKRLGAQIAGIIEVESSATNERRDGLDFCINGNIETSKILEQTSNEYGPFDLILCLDVLEHLVDPWMLVKRIDAVLAPGGALVISIPNLRHVSASMRLLFGKWDYRQSGVLDRTHLRFFVKKTAIDLATTSGMILEKVESTRSKNYRIPQLICNALTFGIFKEFFEWQYLIRVRKPA